jgi:fatty acid amide hydrolase
MLTRVDATSLVQLMSRREVSAVEIAHAYIARVEQVDDRLQAMPVRYFERALREASRVDNRLASGDDVGLLAGVPVSLKECFDVAGTPTTIGLTHRTQPAPEDSWLVPMIAKAGGILIGKTNVPQLMLMYETDNPVYGRTTNPWNDERVCGGSSGGEAAAVSAGLSALGIGTDLAGSIRVPATFCGVCGLKPTSHRLPQTGVAGVFRGMEAFVFQPGPLARSVADLRLAMQILTAEGPQGDPNVPPLKESWSPRPVEGLRVASAAPDAVFPRHPSVERAMSLAETSLRDQGVLVERVEIPGGEQAFDLYVRLLAADGGADVRRLANGSRLDRRVRQMVWMARLPNPMRPIMAMLLRGLGAGDEARFVRAARRLSADEYWQLVDRLQTFGRSFDDWMRTNRWDAWLSPACRIPAFRHGQSLDLLVAPVDACLANLLGTPAGVVPITRVHVGEQIEAPKGRRTSWRDRALCRADQDAAGLPVGVQLAARRWQDRRVLDLLQAIEDRAWSDGDVLEGR